MCSQKTDSETVWVALKLINSQIDVSNSCAKVKLQLKFTYGNWIIKFRKQQRWSRSDRASKKRVLIITRWTERRNQTIESHITTKTEENFNEFYFYITSLARLCVSTEPARGKSDENFHVHWKNLSYYVACNSIFSQNIIAMSRTCIINSAG